MRRSGLKTCLVLAVLGMMAASIGCYETLFRLAPLDEARVDRELCGNWVLRATSGAEVYLGVRNLDDHLYSVTWRSADSPTPLQLVADTTLVDGVRFAHARALPDDGSLADTHLLVRIDVEGDRMTLRNLDDEFLKLKKIESDDALRAEIVANLENNDLYDDAVFSGERVKEED